MHQTLRSSCIAHSHFIHDRNVQHMQLSQLLFPQLLSLVFLQLAIAVARRSANEFWTTLIVPFTIVNHHTNKKIQSDAGNVVSRSSD